MLQGGGWSSVESNANGQTVLKTEREEKTCPRALFPRNQKPRPFQPRRRRGDGQPLRGLSDPTVTRRAQPDAYIGAETLDPHEATPCSKFTQWLLQLATGPPFHKLGVKGGARETVRVTRTGPRINEALGTAVG